MLALALIIGLAMFGTRRVAGAASTVVVVTPGNLHGWAPQARDAGGTPVPLAAPPCNASANFVNGPGTPPLGVGSVQLKAGNGTTGGDCSGEIRSSNYQGVKLSDLTALSYWTYDASNNGQQFPYLEIYVNNSGGTDVEDALFFEPPYQSPGTGGVNCATQAPTLMVTWQQWNALGGCWWSGDGTLNPGTATGSVADYLAVHPNATIVNSSTGGGIHLLVGLASPEDRFDGNVDGFRIATSSSDTTYDFEAAPPTPTSKDQCKNNGWKTLQRANGTTFKNQGDCVSYTNTGK